MVVNIIKPNAREGWNRSKAKAFVALRFAFRERRGVRLSAKDIAEVANLSLSSLVTSLPKWSKWGYIRNTIDNVTREKMYTIVGSGLQWLDDIREPSPAINALGKLVIHQVDVETIDAELKPRFDCWLNERRCRRHEALVAECEAAIARLKPNLHLRAKEKAGST